jgi:23S rRNA pseudouridine2605 synthase
MRIQRALARAGAASRRGAEELVAAGRVTVNGVPATTGQPVDPAHDDIRVDGRKLAAPAALRWLVLHKPAGVI